MKWFILCAFVAFCSASHMNREEMDAWWTQQMCEDDRLMDKMTECTMKCPDQVLSIVQECCNGSDVAEAFRGICNDPETSEQKWKQYDTCAKAKFCNLFGIEGQEMEAFSWNPSESDESESISSNEMVTMMTRVFQGEDLTKIVAAFGCFHREMASYWESNKPSCEE